MTKKDYELIASIIDELFSAHYDWNRRLKQVAYKFSDKLSEKNPKFNKIKFLEACGVGQHCACEGCHNIAEQYYKGDKYCDGHYTMIYSTN